MAKNPMQVKWANMLAGAALAVIAAWVIAGILSNGFGRDDLTAGGAAAGRAFPTMPPVPAFPPGTGPLPRDMMVPPGRRAAVMVPAAGNPGGNFEAGGVPNYIGRGIQLFEAHWQGLDTRLLDSELRRKLKYPSGLEGLLVDEVTLNSIDAGFLAGDVIVGMGDARVTTIEEFQRLTMMVRNQRQAVVTVLRKGEIGGDGRYTMYPVTLVMRAGQDLGFAQVEAAPIILPGDVRPHSYRGPCTQCHAIGVGLELTPDPDLITLPPPRITTEVAQQELSPHRNRGPCAACHVIME